MSEEKNDNLLDTDGNLENNSIENKQSETEILEEIVAVETSDSASVEQVEETIETGSVLRRLLCLSL